MLCLKYKGSKLDLLHKGKELSAVYIGDGLVKFGQDVPPGYVHSPVYIDTVTGNTYSYH